MLRRGFVGLMGVLLTSGTALAQTGTITGRVASTEGAAPIVGAHVVVAGTTIGGMTREDGRYTISVRPGTYTLRASRIGFTPDSVGAVTVAQGGTATINFQLRPSAAQLSQVVVVGYGKEEARNLTGSVSTLNSAQFNPGRVVSPEALIQAKVPGVQVVGTNEPGATVNIRIRGGSSVTSSNEPLFVVDGVPLAIGGGITDFSSSMAGRDPLNFLNPNDIENITVLKDASATAIYGSRGANGVIIITTKSGRNQPAQVTYTGSVSTSHVVGGPDLLNAAQLRAAVQKYAPSNASLLGAANTNWLDAVEQSATGQEHNLAFGGARQDMNYRLSLGYLDQGGVLQGTTAKRVSTAIDYSDQFFGHALNVQANVKASRTNDAFTPGNVLGSAVAYLPTQPIFASGGTYYNYTNALAPANPVQTLALVTDRGNTNRSVGNLQGTYNLPGIPGLSGTVNLGYDYAGADRVTFYPSTEYTQIANATGGSYSENSPSQLNTVLDAYGTYARTLEQMNSHVELTAGYSFERAHAVYSTLSAQGLATDLLGANGIPAARTDVPTRFVDESRLASYFGRANLTFHDKYLFSASIRRDGSSKFGPSNQWGVFPSFGLGWRVIDEGFMKHFSTISDLKLRYSYGVNGNQAFASYQAYPQFTYANVQAQYPFGTNFITTVRPSAVDPNIQWEQTKASDIGADWGLFNNRLTGTVDYYSKKTTNLIFTVPIAAGTNLSNYLTTNIGSLQNRGVEFGVNARVFDGGKTGGFTWDAAFTAAHNTNKLLAINAAGTGNQQILVGGIAGGVGSNIEVLEPGLPVNSFFVYRTRTVNGKPVTGDTTDIAMYVDRNGDKTINQDDRVAYHSPQPNWILGHTSTMSWRNFDASFTLRANTGNYVYNNVASNLGHYSAVQGGAPSNLHASVLQYGFVNPQYFSDLYVEDASFLKMDNIQLGYTLPKLRQVRSVRIYGTIQNVFTVTNYTGVDPEAGLNGIDNTIYPRSRTFTVGTNIGF